MGAMYLVEILFTCSQVVAGTGKALCTNLLLWQYATFNLYLRKFKAAIVISKQRVIIENERVI